MKRDRGPCRQASAGELEGRVGAQNVEIIGVLVAATDSEDAGADHVGDAVGDPSRIAVIWNALRQPFGNPEAPLGQRQQHDAAIRSETPAVERGGDLLAANCWKREREKAIVEHGGRGLNAMA